MMMTGMNMMMYTGGDIQAIISLASRSIEMGVVNAPSYAVAFPWL